MVRIEVPMLPVLIYNLRLPNLKTALSSLLTAQETKILVMVVVYASLTTTLGTSMT